MPTESATYLDNASAQMRKGILEFCVLLAVSRREAYASDIIEALKSRDLLVVEGTLYPLLSRLREAGLVKYEWVESREGPPRKYYALTDKGSKALKELVVRWNQLATSISNLIARP
jgi:PadR family transcriptional regulator PadR